MPLIILASIFVFVVVLVLKTLNSGRYRVAKVGKKKKEEEEKSEKKRERRIIRKGEEEEEGEEL